MFDIEFSMEKMVFKLFYRAQLVNALRNLENLSNLLHLKQRPHNISSYKETALANILYVAMYIINKPEVWDLPSFK